MDWRIVRSSGRIAGAAVAAGDDLPLYVLLHAQFVLHHEHADCCGPRSVCVLQADTSRLCEEEHQLMKHEEEEGVAGTGQISKTPHVPRATKRVILEVRLDNN